MPDKSASVVSYAAGASLAAAALIYVFAPTFAIDHEGTNSRKKSIIGLRNQANDCFINSVLQALAGLGELRVYLIRETHRRRIEDPAVYASLVQPEGKEIAQWKLQGLQEGLVTQGLKDMLDALNERPIYKKSISPFQFVKVLEVAFKQRISRQQQDAQEFLQIVAERLKDEYHSGQRARLHARRRGILASVENLPINDNGHAKEDETEEDTPETTAPNGANGSAIEPSADTTIPQIQTTDDLGPLPLELEEGFPMEGKYESHLECQTCRYKTKPREETFCTITLAVPQVSSTSLNACFDGIFKTEYIDDFKCEMCRLIQTKANLEHDMAKSTSETYRAHAEESLRKLQFAIDTDPENPPEDIELGDIRYAPKRKIAKTTRMSLFPKILAIHLSRSIYGAAMTQKNSAKVAFPEQLPLGGIMDQRKYKLLGLVTHRGGHNSGHYEAFRRQNLAAPFSNSNTFQASEVYSKAPTPISTPTISARVTDSSAMSTPDLLSGSSGNSSTPSLESSAPPRSVPADSNTTPSPSTNGKDKDETGSLRSVAASTRSAISRLTSPRQTQEPGTTPTPVIPSTAAKKPRKRKSTTDKWWRVSDEKVKEAKTSEVLGMQREVYLLFYELEKEES
ncbi:Fc.00g063200.m01.CDS01 [Cosmosporella sp. VM-42]